MNRSVRRALEQQVRAEGGFQSVCFDGVREVSWWISIEDMREVMAARGFSLAEAAMALQAESCPFCNGSAYSN